MAEGDQVLEQPDERVRQLLSRILESATFPASRELAAQIPFVRVTGGPVTMLDLTVEGGSRSAAQDGPIRVRVAVSRGVGDLTGELLIWIKDGYLSCLEFAWVTDDRPENLPSPNELEILDG